MREVPERLTTATSASGETADITGASIMALESVLSSDSIEDWCVLGGRAPVVRQ